MLVPMTVTLESKLHMPVNRGPLVPRPRLAALLGDGTTVTLTLVSAPAGFGKTTLLADALAAAGRPVAWLSLDRDDNDPARFWTYVATALSRPPESCLTALLNDLAARTTDVVLVLDDYHVIDATEIHDGMAFLLEHLPPRAHVVIAGRADPPFPLARMRASGELVEIRAADLRFTPDEAAAYLGDAVGPDLAPADVAALEERTEGWIAALQLAALSLRGRSDISGVVARFAGTDRYVVDYLVEEVLAHQPDAVRDFLLRTAVLDRLTGPLCDAVTGRDDGTRMLVELERANLFLVPLDDHREWYRYHHLFADVLRARLPGGQAPLLHGRASVWHERHDQPEDAVRHALAAGDVDRAARLMELAVPEIRRTRQDTLFLGWLGALPDDVVRRSPVLSVFRGWMFMLTGDLDAFERRLDDAERAAPPAADSAELRRLPATIAVYRASIAQARGDLAGTAEHARRALALAGPDDHLARGGGYGFLGLAAWAEGDVTTALETFGRSVTSLYTGGNLVDALSGTVLLADMWRAAGRPDTARGLLERAVAGAPSDAADLHVALSELDHATGDHDSARRHLDTAVVLDERVRTAAGRSRWFVAASLLAEADEAVRLLDEAEAHHLPGHLPEVRPVPAMQARVRITQGRLADAADWARERGVTVADEARHLREYDHLTLVRLLLAQRRAAQAVPLLERLLDAAESSGRAGSAVEIRRLLALAREGRSPTPVPDLTDREQQVLRLLAGDRSGPQIARELYVTQNTLRTHTKHIFTKLAVTDRRAAVRRAHELGLLYPDPSHHVVTPGRSSAP
jgi:LuxR family maltose regulon positive regulatory protein